MSTEETLRLTVAALLSRTGERQSALADAIGLSPTGLSRRQTGRARWTLDDVDRLAAHWGMPPLDLLSGPSHAAEVLPADRLQTPAPDQLPTPVEPQPASAPAEAPPMQILPPDSTSGAAETCVLCGRDTTARASGRPQHMYGLCVGGQLPTTQQQANPVDAPAPVAPANGPAVPAPTRPSRPRPAEGDLGTTITATVAAALREHDGDVDAAQAALIKRAIPDVMRLFHQSRAGGRYEHRDFPPTEDILKKPSQKGADAIWEGRPKWQNTAVTRAAKAGEHGPVDVTALDANAAYLAAWKTRLPLGRLVHDTSGRHDPKKAGLHLITPPAWDHPDLPSPLGARIEPGDLWITEPTLRLLLDCAAKGLCDPPTIRESYTSGSTEALLEKLRRTLVDVRANALATGDDLTVEYIKTMYSKFVSTIGTSSANREIRRPDWMHIIRSQAFANLWRKAEKAHRAGLTVVQMSGTDELHLAGDWRTVFAEGRGLAEMKPKDTYTLGSSAA